MEGSLRAEDANNADNTHGAVDAQFAQLAKLIRERNGVDVQLGEILGRPATVGDIGEWIAAKVFEIKLAAAPNNTAFDGYFTTGSLSERTVNVKTYLRQDFTLDMSESEALDYYLVFTGPKSQLGSSRGTSRPFCIESVYLFRAEDLLTELRRTGVKVGYATSVTVAQWNAAQIYPQSTNPVLVPTDRQKARLAMFCPEPARLSSTAGVPEDTTLPFFAYGIFSPGQIAFFQIKNYVRRVADASVNGILLIRDGIPILDADAPGETKGNLIEFNDDEDAELAYRAIEGMEPSTQYRWVEDRNMNVLVGRSPRKGSREMPTKDGHPDWSSWRDPAFNQALDAVRANLEEPFAWDDLRSFYSLQGAYMVLWSSIERYVSLRYGLGRNDQVLQRVKLLAEEDQFRASLRATDASATERKLRRLFRSDDPGQAETFKPLGRPVKAIDYLYQVRSNVTHRGKEEPLDWDLLHTATTELLRIFEDVLDAAEENARWTDTSSR